MDDRQVVAGRTSRQGHAMSPPRPVVSARRAGPGSPGAKGLGWKLLKNVAVYAAGIILVAWAYLGGKFNMHAPVSTTTDLNSSLLVSLVVIVLIAVAYIAYHKVQRIEQPTTGQRGRAPTGGSRSGRTVHDDAVAWRNSQRSRREPLPEPPQRRIRPAREFDAGVWAWRGKLGSYLKACLAYLSALFFLMALGQGRSPIHDPLSGLGMIIPGAYLAIVMIPVVVPAILFLSKMAAQRSVPRGIADIAIGAALNAIYLVPPVTALLSKGQLPGFNELWHGLAGMAAGGFGGFMFWRAEGYPGVSHDATPPAADPAAVEH